MKLNYITPFIALFTLCTVYGSWAHSQPLAIAEVAPGVQKVSVSQADQFTPYRFSTEKPRVAALSELPAAQPPFRLQDIGISINSRGVLIELPLEDNEQLYGFGMQIGSFNQRGLRKRPIVNDNPLNDLGYTHAPMAYYVSNKGYAILVNTSHYTTFYCGSTNKLKGQNAAAKSSTGGGNSVNELYANRSSASGNVTVDVPGAKGIEIFVFNGPNMLTAMQRYNLFAGGGALPALWGLGVKYRVKADFNQQQVSKMAAYFRSHHLPCDVLGLEPRWQTTAYSCSYVWNRDFFPQPKRMIDSMGQQGFHINLWEHAFVNPASPLYTQLKDKAGNYLVWNGLVPDFADSTASHLFGGYHRETFIKDGISGFKMDECDNSNLAYGSATWSFPELSRFPSGIDGEQMHQLFGQLYQKAIFDEYKKLNTRTYLDVRSLGAFASPYPVALYSDTYEHSEYIRMIPNSGFSGLLWSPEVRESGSVKELIRRSQTAVLSAQTLYNSWYLNNPPWLQIDKDRNNRDELMPEAQQTEATIQKLLNLRMSLVPYLYNAFADYHFKGIPPFRALVADYPQDKQTYNVGDEYMIGSGILAAPLSDRAEQRRVYLPAGTWYDFNNGKKYEGGTTYTIKPADTELPIFVKEGTVLPLAKPVEYLGPKTQFEITCRVYGRQATGSLFEDDGVTFNVDKGAYNTIALNYKAGKKTMNRTGKFAAKRYVIKGWEVIE